jgi:hypothetical protein
MAKSIKKSKEERIGAPIPYEKRINVPKTELEKKGVRHKELRENVLKLTAEKKATSSAYTAQIKELNDEERSLLEVIDSGTETIEVEAWPVYNYQTGNVRIVEKETGKQLDERAMTLEERDNPILDYMEPAAEGSESVSEEEAAEEAAAKANAEARAAKKAAKKAASKTKEVTHKPTGKPRGRRKAAG